jgi:hypothetical protein
MKMKKLLLATAIAALVASPAFAQHATSRSVAKHNACGFLGHPGGVGANGPGYNAYDDWYAWTPGCYHGRPSPYAQYDQNGRLLSENLPDRW